MCRAVNLSLEGGNSDGSCFAYVMLGISLARVSVTTHGIPLRTSSACELVEKRGLKRFQARTFLNFAYVVLPWMQTCRNGRDLVRARLRAGQQRPAT